MPSQAGSAEFASPAGRVDFAHHAPAGERAALGVGDFADELMAGDAAVGHVSARQLEVGAAYPGHPHPHDTLARRRRGIGMVVADSQFAIEHQRAHRAIETKKPQVALPF